MKVYLVSFNRLVNNLNTTLFVFDMESEQDSIHSTFSTLNVNAVEFVPNFGAPPVKDPETMIEENAKPPIETPENNGNGKTHIDVFVSEENFCHIECRRD